MHVGDSVHYSLRDFLTSAFGTWLSHIVVPALISTLHFGAATLKGFAVG
jgi:hypothetical protein